MKLPILLKSKTKLLISNLVILFFLLDVVYSKDCADYYNPEKFYDAPEFLVELLNSNKPNFEAQKFVIKKDELYKYTPFEIANEINNDFEGFWSDWIEDAYEMKLVPEQTLFRYKSYYLALEVFIYGVKGDATKLKGTRVVYSFFNYTKEVNMFIECDRDK